jgi:hypothetical protein
MAANPNHLTSLPANQCQTTVAIHYQARMALTLKIGHCEISRLPLVSRCCAEQTPRALSLVSCDFRWLARRFGRDCQDRKAMF